MNSRSTAIAGGNPERTVSRALHVLLAGLLVATLALPAGPLEGIGFAQQQQSSIQILNPAATPSANDRPKISNQGMAEHGYHLVARVATVPANPIVQLRIEQNNRRIGTAARVGATDTWELSWQLPGEAQLPDDDYTLQALLFDGINQVAQDSQVIEVDRAASAVRIDQPTNGGQWGVHRPPGSDSWVGLIDFTYSAGTEAVQAFYTLTPPGTEPSWTSCTEDPIAVEEGPASDRLTCELAPEDEGTAVTGVAVVPSFCDPLLGDVDPITCLPLLADELDPLLGLFVFEAGDAHRVFPFVQDLVAELAVAGDQREINVVPGCSPELTFTVTDQQGRPIPRANVDVHATGPLGTAGRVGFRFDMSTGADGTDPNQAPDAEGSHDSTSPAWNCATNEAAPASQNRGNHPRPIGADTRHIESIHTGNNPRTDINGRFRFRVFNDEPVGATQITAWVDRDNDDLFCEGDPAAHTSLGWNTPPPVVTGHDLDPGCPEPPPTPRPDDEERFRTIGLKARPLRNRGVARGRVRLVESGRPTCVRNVRVRVQRRPLRGGSWNTIRNPRTNQRGFYRTRNRILRRGRPRPGRYRAIAPRFRFTAGDGTEVRCRRTVSPVRRVRRR